MAEQPAYGIRQVTERTSRSNGGCVEVETGRSWPAALSGVRAALQPLQIPGLSEWQLTGAFSYSPYRPKRDVASPKKQRTPTEGKLSGTRHSTQLGCGPLIGLRGPSLYPDTTFAWYPKAT